MIQNVHVKSSETVLKTYKPPCNNDHMQGCDCGQLAKDWLTDYTWICPFRKFMTQNIRTSNPFYAIMMTSTLPHGYWQTPVRLFRKCIDSEVSCHCSDSILYFGMARERWLDDSDQLDDATEQYIDLLQQVVTNFIRTGDPNDYTGSPTQHKSETIWPYHQIEMVFLNTLQYNTILFSLITWERRVNGQTQLEQSNVICLIILTSTSITKLFSKIPFCTFDR